MNHYLLSLAMFSGLFFSSGANASFGGGSTHCSNSNDTIKYSTRIQDENSVTWSEPQVDDKGRTSYVPIQRKIPSYFSPPDFVVDIEVIFERIMELEKVHKSGCRSGGEKWSWESGWTDFLGKVTIVKKDGSAFPKDTRNLSQDGKTISAHLMCTSSYYYEKIPCDL